MLIILLISTFAFAQDIPEHVKKLATEPGIVYVGMPKEDLYKTGFTELMQKDYHKDGNEEWITFLDYSTEEHGDLITFHLTDGKVVDWERHEKEPEKQQTEL